MKKLLLLSFVSLLAAFSAEAVKVASVKAVSADGPDENIGDVISRCRVKPGQDYDAQQTSRDVRELRDSGEYDDVTVKVEEGTDGLEVT